MATPPPALAEAAILGPTSELVRRIEIYEQDATTRWMGGDFDDRLIGGSVSIDYSRDERRSFEVELDNSDFALQHTPEGFWYDKIIKVFCGVHFVDTTPITSTVVRTNLATNPRVGTATTAWTASAGTGAGSAARITAAGSPAADTAYEFTWSTASSSVSGWVAYQSPAPGTVVAGQPYSGSIYGRSSKSQRLRGELQFFNEAGSSVGSAVVSSGVVVAGNAWQQFKIENAVAPAGATRAMLTVAAVAGTGAVNWAVGDKLAATGVMIEKTTKIANTFTGATQNFANRAYAWTGPADASTSTETVTVSTPTATATTWEVQVGEFMIDSISEDHFPPTVKVSGRDYTKKCLLSKFAQATAFASGSKIEDVIKAIAQNAGVTKFILPLTGSQLGKDYFFERGTERWAAMKDIASGFGYELFFDAQGYLVMRQFQDPITAPLAYTLETGAYGTLVSYTKAVNDTRIYNHIVVTGESSDSALPPVSAEALNNEPSSPTRIAELGDRLYQYTSAFITTTAQAQDVATKFLKIYGMEEFNLDFSSIALPWLEVGEIIEFIDPRPDAGQPTRFLLSSLSLPLDLGAMSGNAKRVSVVG